MVGFLIWYTDTVRFYKQYKSEIDEMLYEYMSETGIYSLPELFGKKWDEEDPLGNSDFNMNLLAWFGFEEADETAVEEKKEEPSGLSPLFLKYYTYVDKYPNDIIAMRVGDFYEVFGVYAKQVAEVADLTLTSRDVGLPDRMEMVGFPYHAKEKYITKIQKHYAVTVVDSENEIVSYPVQMPEIKVNTETGEVLEEPTHDPELVAIVKRILEEEIEVI